MTLRGALAARGQIGAPLATAAGGAAAGPWWNPDGATPAAVCGAWQAKGAASLAASYLNLATLGYANIDPAIVGGVAPGWAAGTGWSSDGTQYLLTGIFPSSSYSMLARFSDVLAGGSKVGGIDAPSWFFWRASFVGYVATYFSNLDYYVAPALSTGVLGLTKEGSYRNGVLDIAISAPDFAPGAQQIGMLCTGSGIQGMAGNMQAFAIYDVVLSAPQVLARATAMAAL
jgi:hypothetical protein